MRSTIITAAGVVTTERIADVTITRTKASDGSKSSVVVARGDRRVEVDDLSRPAADLLFNRSVGYWLARASLAIVSEPLSLTGGAS